MKLDWETVWEQFDGWWSDTLDFDGEEPEREQIEQKIQELVEAQIGQQRAA